MIQKTIRDKDGHYIMLKGSVSQEDITILMCMHLTIVSKYNVRQKLIELKREMYKSTIVVGDLNTPLSVIDPVGRKISKEKMT